MTESPSTTIVAAAVIHDDEGRVLLARRPPGSHMGGLWELPGGKARPDESPAAALRRELDEELGVDAEVGSPLTFAVHEEATRRIVLLFFSASIAGGRLRARWHDEIEWVAPSALHRYRTPPADAALVRRLAEHG